MEALKGLRLRHRAAATRPRQAWVRLAYQAILLLDFERSLRLVSPVCSAADAWSENESDEEARPSAWTRWRNPEDTTSCATTTRTGGTRTSSTPNHPPFQDEKCLCRGHPKASRLQVKDTNKETWGRFFFRCARAECKMFKWEELPADRNRWPYMIGSPLSRSAGVHPMEPALCSHAPEFLKAQGGAHLSMKFGGRWERGPMAHTLMGKERARTLSALTMNGCETILGRIRSDGRTPSHPEPSRARASTTATRSATTSAPSSPDSSRLSQAQDPASSSSDLPRLEVAAPWQEIHQLQNSSDQTVVRRALRQVYAELQQMRAVQSAMLGQAAATNPTVAPAEIPVFDLTMEVGEDFELEGWTEPEGEEI